VISMSKIKKISLIIKKWIKGAWLSDIGSNPHSTLCQTLRSIANERKDHNRVSMISKYELNEIISILIFSIGSTINIRRCNVVKRYWSFTFSSNINYDIVLASICFLSRNSKRRKNSCDARRNWPNWSCSGSERWQRIREISANQRRVFRTFRAS